MKRIQQNLLKLTFALILGSFFLMGADGCSSDPNVEGAKLNLKNKDYAKAIENLDLALEKNPENGEAWSLKANVYSAMSKSENDAMKRGDIYADMLEALDNATKYGADAEEISNLRYGAWATEINDGITDFGAEGRMAQAASHFGNASVLLPDSSQGHSLQGRALYQLQKFDEAIEPLKMGIAKNTTDPVTYTLLGSIYIQQKKDCAAAVPILEKGVSAFPDDTDVSSLMTEAYKCSGQIERAKQRYMDAIAKDPSDIDARIRLGNLLLQAEDYEGAIEHLEKALEIDSESDFANYYIGFAYFNKAAQLSKQINELSDMAEVDRMTEQMKDTFRKAMPYLEKTRANNDAAGESNSRICESLYSVYVRLGEDDKAKDAANCAGIDLN